MLLTISYYENDTKGTLSFIVAVEKRVKHPNILMNEADNKSVDVGNRCSPPGIWCCLGVHQWCCGTIDGQWCQLGGASQGDGDCLFGLKHA